jgi:hypothetical protein
MMHKWWCHVSLVPMSAARSGSPATAPVGDDAQPTATAPPAKMSFAQMMKSGPKPGALPMTRIF